MPELIICPQCGHALDPRAAECGVCGSPARCLIGASRPLPAKSPALEGHILQVQPCRGETREFSLLRATAKFVLGSCALTGYAIWNLVSSLLGGHSRPLPWEYLLLSRRQQEPQHQMVEFSVHTVDGSQRLAVLKGKRIRGFLLPGHAVALWGKWQGGVLWVTRGFNRTTNSWFGVPWSFEL